MPIQKIKDVSVDLNRVGDKLSIDLKRINFKNSCLFIFLFFIFYILAVKGIGKNLTIYLFDQRSSVFSILTVGVICLIIIRCLEIFKQKGISAITTSDRFLGEVGELVIRAFSILSAAYSGFIVISLIILEKFPEEVPKEGLIFIFLLMLFLLGWSGFEIWRLIVQSLIVTPFSSPVKEVTNITDMMDIMYCSNLTAEEIKSSYLPKKKNSLWYDENCIGEIDIPECAINGHLGGTPFYTKDKKIMRSGKSTWDKLNIKPCLE